MPGRVLKKSCSVPPLKRRTPSTYTESTPLFTLKARWRHWLGWMRRPVLPSSHWSLPLHNMVLPSQLCGTIDSHCVENGKPAPSMPSLTAPKKLVVNGVITVGLIQNDTVYS